MRIFSDLSESIIALNGVILQTVDCDRLAGVDHLVFGSDYPSCQETIIQDSMDALQRTRIFTEEEKKKSCIKQLKNFCRNNLLALLRKVDIIELFGYPF